MKTLIENILILFKRFDIPIILFFVAVLTVIGIYKGWIYIIGLITLAIIGVAIFVVAMLVKDYLDEKQTKIKSPYFKFFIVRLTWVSLFALVFSLVIKLSLLLQLTKHPETRGLSKQHGSWTTEHGPRIKV